MSAAAIAGAIGRRSVASPSSMPPAPSPPPSGPPSSAPSSASSVTSSPAAPAPASGVAPPKPPFISPAPPSPPPALPAPSETTGGSRTPPTTAVISGGSLAHPHQPRRLRQAPQLRLQHPQVQPPKLTRPGPLSRRHWWPRSPPQSP